MRSVIVKMEVSVDAYVGADGVSPAWPVQYYEDNDELAAYEYDLLPLFGAAARLHLQDVRRFGDSVALTYST